MKRNLVRCLLNCTTDRVWQSDLQPSSCSLKRHRMQYIPSRATLSFKPRNFWGYNTSISISSQARAVCGQTKLKLFVSIYKLKRTRTIFVLCIHHCITFQEQKHLSCYNIAALTKLYVILRAVLIYCVWLHDVFDLIHFLDLCCRCLEREGLDTLKFSKASQNVLQNISQMVIICILVCCCRQHRAQQKALRKSNKMTAGKLKPFSWHN